MLSTPGSQPGDSGSSPEWDIFINDRFIMKIVICRLKDTYIMNVGPKRFYACGPMKRGGLAWFLSGGQLAGGFFSSRRELISRIRERYRHEKHLHIIDKTT